MKLNTDPIAAIRPGNPLWLPMGGPHGTCGSTAPLPPHFGCTREPGHSGDHAAHTGPDKMVARWERFPAPTRPPAVRLLRIIEYVGTREWVDDQINKRNVKGRKIVRDGYILEGFVGEVPQLVDRPTFEAQTVEHAAMIVEENGCCCGARGESALVASDHARSCPVAIAGLIREALGR